MLHIDVAFTVMMDRALSREDKFEQTLSAIEELLGANGTLLVPGFTYSFCKGEDFDVANSACSPNEVGLFSEYVRQQPGTKRSADPIFSVLARGARADYFSDVAVGDCFGKGSVFEKIYQENVKIICVGCSLDRATLIHYSEQSFGIDYRFPKQFSGKIIFEDGSEKEVTTSYLVRDYEKKFTSDLSLLKKNLEGNGQFQSAALGRVAVYCTNSQDFHNEVGKILKEYPHGLVKHDIHLD